MRSDQTFRILSYSSNPKFYKRHPVQYTSAGLHVVRRDESKCKGSVCSKPRSRTKNAGRAIGALGGVGVLNVVINGPSEQHFLKIDTIIS